MSSVLPTMPTNLRNLQISVLLETIKLSRE